MQDLLATACPILCARPRRFRLERRRATADVSGQADLRSLLTAAKVAGPYVLVGHSMGALLARRYASHYPDGIVGMVLAGPTHENTRLFFPADNQWKRVREQPTTIGAEFQELYLAREANPVPLGDRPLIVLVGTRPDPNVSTPEDVSREKAAELEDQPRISRNSKLVRDPSSGHHIQVDNPKLVAAAIEEVVADTAALKGLVPPASRTSLERGRN